MKSFTARFARMLAYAAGTPWHTLTDYWRAWWMIEAGCRMIALYDARVTRRG